MQHVMNPVIHFELPAEDRERMASFYTQAFGWETQMLGKEMGNYVVVTTTKTDEKRVPKVPGAINGGFYMKAKTKQVPTVVIGVEDIYAAMKKVEAAGGKVLGGQAPGKPDDIPGIGLYASFIDTEGNQIALLQPKDGMDVNAGK
jgi:predicted enzyme related to lactoylglutathione lyase